MVQIIKLDKYDIHTRVVGDNISIIVSDKFQVIFTRDALNEFIKDYNLIKEKENNTHVI
jgi:hypothetical protein